MAEAAVNNQVEMIFTRIAVALESLVTAQRLPKPVPTISGFLLAAKVSKSQQKSDIFLGQPKSQLKSDIFA